jgi:gluconate 2-dehydrogenase gamma chain
MTQWVIFGVSSIRQACPLPPIAGNDHEERCQNPHSPDDARTFSLNAAIEIWRSAYQLQESFGECRSIAEKSAVVGRVPVCWMNSRPGENVMAENGVRRRDVLKGLGVTGTVAGIAATMVGVNEAQPHAHAAARTGGTADVFRFFTPPEAMVVVALVDTLIPKDDVGPGGVEAGVPVFIDRELASAYGRGARMYLDGPFAEGTAEQGYQLPLPPADLYRVGIADLNAWCAKTRGGKTFDQLSVADRTVALEAVEAGQAEFAQVPARTFFSVLLQNTMEGYFADPMYGGNRDNEVWKMIGFPGAVGMYADLIEEYRNRQYDVAPKSIQDLS